MLAVNKGIILTSSRGAAATLIDARFVSSDTNVLLIMQDGEFGRPGEGFTVTHTNPSGFTIGIGIDSQNVAVRGNQVIQMSPQDPQGVGLAVIKNYWGSPFGPGPDPADDVCGKGTATVVPFATTPFDVRARIRP